MNLKQTIVTLCCALLVTITHAKTAPEFIGANHSYNTDIPLPAASLGFELGERHIRHDQLVAYMEAVANVSDRVKLTDMGRTTEFRKQLLLTISSPENLANLPALLNERKDYQAPLKDNKLIVWLGYSVHGDEISGANASLAVVYHFAASQDKSVDELLKDTIIVVEPSINPDGMDRFVNWVYTHGGITPNDDANHIEHHQGWRTGRTNHFGFDLNRDWLLLAHQETRNRLKYFHQYRPHVLGDFHEMGANSSYFFQPGIPSRTNPLTSKENIALTNELAKFHAGALDQEKRLYYSKENFDDFYYGKGSTYPDINGSVGILFEQASSRGMQQQTVNGLLTFEYSIHNQVLTSLSTVEGAWKNQQRLKTFQREFYNGAKDRADDEKFDGYIVGSKDTHRMTLFLDKLKQHQINAYQVTKSITVNKKTYRSDEAYYIPLAQAQYGLIKALFTTQKSFQDNTFYDVSGWTLPLAMDIPFAQVKSSRSVKTAQQAWQKASDLTQDVAADGYAYIFNWHYYNSPALLNDLLASGISAKVATKSFGAEIDGKKRVFPVGTVMIPDALQQNTDWQQQLIVTAKRHKVPLQALTTGFSTSGIDLGSGSFRLLKQPKVLLVGGKGTSQYEAAEVLYTLDQEWKIPVTVVEKQRLHRIDLADYSHVFMVDGVYSDVTASLSKKLDAWVKQGGVIYGQKRAAQWLATKGMLDIDFVSKKQIESVFDTGDLSYQDKESLAARKRIAGAIFESTIDLSHPLAYGFGDAQLPLFRNSTLIMELPIKPFRTVAKYTESPLMSGYTDELLVDQVANNAAIVAHNHGKGRVVATADVLAFRGYWQGSAKLLANILFFGHAFSAN
ncbi:M14 family zinc carboxypeptidase [Thalassotalea agarivorans]|uniref:Zinc carboxypeptidase n=1 Tax=Thalassotalea agarivorans TaxID=349064 RepID=A0A1I0HNU8_THASX|nr:M14 family zinc carboxypeptidase [Thalassotalea agarivorans]SET85426.1 Zinc carboxypeptidase [Thalassotalea agarivorans]